jgi:hypothetical protein
MRARGWWLVAALLVARPALPAEAAPPALSGGFIQYWGGMEGWGADKWHPVLERMHAAGLTTVVIQRLRSEPKDPKEPVQDFIGTAIASPDATEVILAYAQEHGMHVYVGLMMHRLNGDPLSSAAEYLEKAAKENNEVADRAWTRYKKYEAFRGWYIPLEPWMAVYSDDEVEAWRKFLTSVAGHCRGLAKDRSVAFSPFIDANAARPEGVAKVYKRMLEETGVDVLMLQDGMGERTAGPMDVGPWYKALAATFAGSTTKVWANVENFEWSDPCGVTDRVPTTWPRLEARIAAVAPHVPKVVTFDFFHYMNDTIPLDAWCPARRKRAAALYAKYKASLK